MAKKIIDKGFDMNVQPNGVDYGFDANLEANGVDNGFDINTDGILNNQNVNLSHKTFVENNMQSFLASLDVDARNLDLATPEMLNDESVIYRAAQSRMHGDEALKYASDRLKYDKDFVKQVLLVNGDNIKYVDKELLDDEEIIESAMINSNNPYILLMASQRLQSDAKFINKVMKESLRGNIDLLGYLDPKMWDNKDIVKLALDNTSSNDLKPYVAKLADKYSNDAEIMGKLVKADFTNIRFASDELKHSNYTFKECSAKFDALEGLKNGTAKLKDLDKKYFKDEEFYDKVQEEYEARLEEIAKQKLEIQDNNKLKQKAKQFMFDAKQKLGLARLMGYAVKANAEQFIQDKKEALMDAKEEIKQSLQEFMSNMKGTSKDKETRWTDIFAKNVKGADINKLQDAVIATKNAEYIYNFARDIEGADIEKLREAIIATGDEHYTKLFTKEVLNDSIDIGL